MERCPTIIVGEINTCFALYQDCSDLLAIPAACVLQRGVAQGAQLVWLRTQLQQCLDSGDLLTQNSNVQGRVLRRVMFRNGKLELFDAHVEHVGLAVMSGLVEQAPALPHSCMRIRAELDQCLHYGYLATGSRHEEWRVEIGFKAGHVSLRHTESFDNLLVAIGSGPVQWRASGLDGCRKNARHFEKDAQFRGIDDAHIDISARVDEQVHDHRVVVSRGFVQRRKAVIVLDAVVGTVMQQQLHELGMALG